MSYFEIFAHGESFDPDAFLRTTTLKCDGKWYKGQYGSNHPESSGVNIRLGDGGTLELDEQEQIALEFLKANREALKHLSGFPGVTTFILGIEVDIEVAPNIVCTSFGVSPHLAWQALDVGIELVFYLRFRHVNLEDQEPPEASG